jgi:hypothetical protein
VPAPANVILDQLLDMGAPAHPVLADDEDWDALYRDTLDALLRDAQVRPTFTASTALICERVAALYVRCRRLEGSQNAYEHDVFRASRAFLDAAKLLQADGRLDAPDEVQTNRIIEGTVNAVLHALEDTVDDPEYAITIARAFRDHMNAALADLSGSQAFARMLRDFGIEHNQ